MLPSTHKFAGPNETCRNQSTPAQQPHILLGVFDWNKGYMHYFVFSLDHMEDPGAGGVICWGCTHPRFATAVKRLELRCSYAPHISGKSHKISLLLRSIRSSIAIVSISALFRLPIDWGDRAESAQDRSSLIKHELRGWLLQQTGLKCLQKHPLNN